MVSTLFKSESQTYLKYILSQSLLSYATKCIFNFFFGKSSNLSFFGGWGEGGELMSISLNDAENERKGKIRHDAVFVFGE